MRDEIKAVQLWLSWLTVFGSLISFILLSYIVPEFEELFAGFGADLPALTKLVIHFHDNFYLLAIPGIVGNIFLHFQKHVFGWSLVGFSGAMAVLLIPLTIVAMYLPIFQMGKVVGG